MRKKKLSDKEKEMLAINIVGNCFAIAVALCGFFVLCSLALAIFKEFF